MEITHGNSKWIAEDMKTATHWVLEESKLQTLIKSRIKCYSRDALTVVSGSREGGRFLIGEIQECI